MEDFHGIVIEAIRIKVSVTKNIKKAVETEFLLPIIKNLV